MTADKPTIRLAISDAVLSPEDVDAMVAAMSAQFDVVRVPLPPRGGPDYFLTLLQLTLTTLQSVGSNIVSSAIWDGLKLWFARYRSIPSFYDPGNTVPHLLEIEVEDVTSNRRFAVTVRVSTSDEKIFEHTIDTFSEEIGKLHRATDADEHQIAYQIEENKWSGWSKDPASDEWFERDADPDQ